MPMFSHCAGLLLLLVLISSSHAKDLPASQEDRDWLASLFGNANTTTTAPLGSTNSTAGLGSVISFLLTNLCNMVTSDTNSGDSLQVFLSAVCQVMTNEGWFDAIAQMNRMEPGYPMDKAHWLELLTILDSQFKRSNTFL